MAACALLLATLPLRATAVNRDATVPERISLHLRGDTAEVMRACFGQFKLQVDILKRPSQPTLRIDLDDADLQTVEQVLGWMTNSFFVAREGGHILALEDTPSNRKRFSAKRYFSLDGLNEENRTKLQELLSHVLGVKASTESGRGFAVEGDAETLEQATQLVALVKQPVPDLLFKVRVYTITDSYESNLGVEPPSTTQGFSLMSEAEQLISSNSSIVDEMIAEGLVSSSDTLEIALLLFAAGYTTSDTANGFVIFGGGLSYMGMSFSSPSLNALLTDSRLHEIDETTLRIADLESGKLRIGERYPIKTDSSVYYSYSTTTSSWTTTTTPNVQYEDLGLTLELSPHLLGNGQVFLAIDWKNQSLTGSEIDEIPVLERRQLSNTVVVPLNSTTVLTGHIARETIGDTEGLSSNGDKTRTGSDVLITITPELASSSDASKLPDQFRNISGVAKH